MNPCVFVIGLTGKRLMPTSPAKARKLIKQKKAIVCSLRPFTIQLLYKTGAATQEVSIGIDTGSQHIGVSIESEGKVLYKAEIQLRSTMEKRKLMETRRIYRRSRRYRKTRYRHPKFRFRTKRVYSKKLATRKSTKHKTHWVKKTNSITSGRKPGWLPPSIQSKIDHHINWIGRFLNILPADSELHIEVARFDIARIKNPTIRGEQYQKGPKYDFENIKAYVFFRDGYRCKCCGVKAGSVRKDGTIVKLVFHHIDFRTKGATDNPDRCGSVCDRCHSPKSHRPGGILFRWMEEGKSFARNYRDATFMNIMRQRLFEHYPDAEFTYGNFTKVDREALGLEKSHANDAVAIAIGTEGLKDNSVPVVYYRQVRKKKRSLYEAVPRKGRKTPNREAKRNSKNTKSSKGFSLWDKVMVDGRVGWLSGFSGNGSSARIVDQEMKFIVRDGKGYSTRQLSELTSMSHNNNWISYNGMDKSRNNAKNVYAYTIAEDCAGPTFRQTGQSNHRLGGLL